jgi:Ca2+ transporting ATPase
MDSLGSLALATEAPNRERLLQREPQKRDDYIVSQKMVKHIIIQSMYQCIVVFGIVFAGEFFIPETPGVIPNNGNFIFPGRTFTYGGEPLYERYVKDYGYSRHMTIVFTCFVYMQVFNMLNARKINDEINIFAGLFTSYMFIAILLIIAIVQFILTQFTQDILKCSRNVSL